MLKNYFKPRLMNRFLLLVVFTCLFLEFISPTTNIAAAITFKLKVKSATMNSITLTWTSQNSAKEYNVYRS